MNVAGNVTVHWSEAVFEAITGDPPNVTERSVDEFSVRTMSCVAV